jgi:plastocyanin
LTKGPGKAVAQFTPDKLSAAVGDTVNWTNKETEGTEHHVKFDDGAESADIAPGKSWTYTAKTKGDFAYLCAIHPSMQGTLHVK